MLIVKRVGWETRIKFQFFCLTFITFFCLCFGLWWIHASFSATTQLRATTTVMEALASQMQPGTWAELNSTGFSNGDMLKVDSTSDYITQYADSATWDPVGRRFLFVGQAHGIGSGARFVIYTDSDNTWRKGPLPLSCLGEPNSSCIGHAYDHNTIDPTTGDLYYRHYHGTTIYRYSAGAWSQLTDVPENVVRLTGTCCAAIEYFPEIGGLIVVAGGLGEVGFFNKQTNQWTQLATGLEIGPYSNFIEYNPVHKVVIFGGGGTSDLYKLDASGKITKMKNAPVNLGIQRSLVSVDPVSGKYLILSDTGRFYEYDLLADSWRTLNLPPFWGSGFVGNGSIDGVVEAPVNTYGVVMFVHYKYNQSKVYLYKHAASGKKT
jgi:hypothetical protein